MKKANERIYVFCFFVNEQMFRLVILLAFIVLALDQFLNIARLLYHDALLVYLGDEFERVQEHALSIIHPGLSHDDNLYRDTYHAPVSQLIEHGLPCRRS